MAKEFELGMTASVKDEYPMMCHDQMHEKAEDGNVIRSIKLG